MSELPEAQVLQKTTSYQEVKEILTSIANEEDKCFLMLTYAVLGRVGEIVKGKYKHNPPISSSQVTTKEKVLENGEIRHLMLVSVLTEKTLKVRVVPINRDREAWLTEPIIRYSERRNGPLFPYSTRWGQLRFQRYFGTQHIHLMRGWRATHLRKGAVTGKVMDWGIISKMGGWTDLKTPQRSYDSTVTEDFEDLI